MGDDRIARQIAFLMEADKLKTITRRTPLTDASRLENSAEHSWHLILTAMVLREYAADPFDLLHVVEMLAVHDLVEIDAGDTFAYDEVREATRAQRERAAAERLFAMLPADQQGHVQHLWEEFEAQQSPESRFANVVDRFQPLLQNVCSQGGSWRTHRLTRDQVLQRMAPIRSASAELWPFVLDVVDRFCAAGVLHRS